MRDLYNRATAAAVPVVRGISEVQLDEPTPCADYSVRELLNHLFQVVEQFTYAARGESMDFTELPDRVVDDWREEFDLATRRLVDAWSLPEAMEVSDSWMGLSRETVAFMPVGDLVLHGWDLAVATGQQIEVDPELLDPLDDYVNGMAPMARENGVFGPAVEVGGDASHFDRILGDSGRDPHWEP